MSNNIVEKKVLRQVQLEALAVMAESVGTSYGPIGSISQLCQDAARNNKNADPYAVNIYTKDGDTIVKSIKFDDIISDSVKSNVVTVTTNQVKKNGDGTTSATIAIYEIFRRLVELEKELGLAPRALVNKFIDAVKNIQDKIKERAQEFNAEAAYKIAFISSNGDETVAETIRDIYKEFGNDVFIDVEPSVNGATQIRKSNGMSLDTGYDNPAFINDYKNNACTIKNPRIYYFQDPVDNTEQLSFLISIIEQNIVVPYEKGNSAQAVPTVILTKYISRDITTQLNKILQFMNQFSNPEMVAMKPKLLIVNNIHQDEALDDLAQMCGCPPILKFNDPKQQEELQKKGEAPSLKNVHDFYGQAESIKADSTSTVIVRPKNMYDKDGNITAQYNAILQGLESQLVSATDNGEDLKVLGKLKKRINSLNSKSVTYFVGGLAPEDRDSLRYLVDDAVLNCRSASKVGVGFAANSEGYIAVTELINSNICDPAVGPDVTFKIYKLIQDAYKSLIGRLYPELSEIELEDVLAKIKEEGPLDVITREHSKDILSSIETDSSILEAIGKIVTLMVTCAQCILPDSTYNKYGTFLID